MDTSKIPFTYRHVPGSDCPVTLLPGLLGGDWIWRSTVERLTRAGYGTLVWNVAVAELDLGEPSSVMSDLCDGALAVLNDLSIDETLVCGNSLGALVGLEFARRHPTRTAGIVVSGCPGLEENMVDDHFFMSRTQSDVFDEYRKRMFYSEPGWVAGFLDEIKEMALDRETMVRILKGFRAARLHDTVESLSEIVCPSCLIWGENDLVTPFDNWRPHVSDLRETEFHVVSECGHSPMVEKIDEWMVLVLDFLGRLVPRADERMRRNGRASPGTNVEAHV
jgi:2-hydroxy-6-oxonona-2,4-dienedioate hydrolase